MLTATSVSMRWMAFMMKRILFLTTQILFQDQQEQTYMK